MQLIQNVTISVGDHAEIPGALSNNKWCGSFTYVHKSQVKAKKLEQNGFKIDCMQPLRGEYITVQQQHLEFPDVSHIGKSTLVARELQLDWLNVTYYNEGKKRENFQQTLLHCISRDVVCY